MQFIRSETLLPDPDWWFYIRIHSIPILAYNHTFIAHFTFRLTLMYIHTHSSDTHARTHKILILAKRLPSHHYHTYTDDGALKRVSWSNHRTNHRSRMDATVCISAFPSNECLLRIRQKTSRCELISLSCRHTDHMHNCICAFVGYIHKPMLNNNVLIKYV